MATPLPATELDAINVMLQAIGESAVLDVDDQLEEVVVARATLSQVSLEVQSHGWTFNTECVTLEKEVGGNRIPVPQNCLSVDPIDPYAKITQRGQWLYDLCNNTFEFCNAIKTTVVYSLDFDCLPNHARQYILARAARIYCERFLGGETDTVFTRDYEMRCSFLFKRIEGRHGDYNILTGSNSTRRVLNRYPRPRYR